MFGRCCSTELPWLLPSPPLVGFCRMYRGFHHLTDVLAGLLLGGVWLWLTTRYVLAKEPA